eukprot:CAMPEP_0171624426 /NCGR_PEP_ID=MMETSP0990-20121206/18614_1 /TAXON_ID=483369 /ORGANISM="non described non described, Strain CCMP2098" /LENGTH=401 /DNA_ID=CAMNT_0012190977 /DNA_START=25 /DNA_END=1230 /DNA_ORIENTATION=+
MAALVTGDDPQIGAVLDPKRLTVSVLKCELLKRGLPTDGKKSVLVKRLEKRQKMNSVPSVPSTSSSSTGDECICSGVASVAKELPYGGDMTAAMKSNDRAAIRTLMDHRAVTLAKKPRLSAQSMSSASSSSASTQICPICSEDKDDVQTLEHASGQEGQGNLSEHAACGECRASMIRTNSSCPWCRSEMVWRNLYGFLNGFKTSIGGASHQQDHQGLANLLTHWQEFEMTRSRSDLSSFARDLCTDSSLAQHTARGILDRDPWLRDCAGLWIRLYAMHADGEISPPLGDEDAARLQACVEVGLCMFEERHGGHEDFVAALYSQVCAATLSAGFSGSSTAAISALTRRAGQLCVEVYQRAYATKPGAKEEVQRRINREYVEAVQEVVWGSAAEDPVFKAFFT